MTNHPEIAKEQERRRAYANQVQKRALEIFKADLREYWMDDFIHEKIYAYAYQENHSCMNDVIGLYENVAELVYDIIDHEKKGKTK